jgi:hypothetical protein
MKPIRKEDIVSPVLIRRQPGMSQRQFAAAIHVPVATLQNRRAGADDDPGPRRTTRATPALQCKVTRPEAITRPGLLWR